MFSRSRNKCDPFPEKFFLICPETVQFQSLEDHWSSLYEFFDKAPTWKETWFWNTLATPVRDVERIQHFHPQARPRRPSCLEQLPNELLEEVFDMLLNSSERICAMEAMLALGLSSPLLYPKVLSRIHRGYANQHVSWAGHSVGFHGQCFCEPEVGRITMAHIVSRVNNSEPEFSWQQCIARTQKKWKGVKETDWQQVSKDVSQMYLYPQERVWVLRNLTTRQYVRSDALKPPPKIIPQDKLSYDPYAQRSKLRQLWNKLTPTFNKTLNYDHEPLTLAQIFLVLSANKAKMKRFDNELLLIDSPWPPFKYDVVTLHDHETSLAPSGPQWQDVTASAVAEVAHLRWCVRQRQRSTGLPVRSGNVYLAHHDGCVISSRPRWHKWAGNRLVLYSWCDCGDHFEYVK